MNPAALARLSALAAARRARDLARVERLLVEAEGLRREIAELGLIHIRDHEEGEMPIAMTARRLVWAENQIAAHERRLAAIAQDLAAARADARESVGKHEVLDRLLAQANREAATARDRLEEAASLAARASLSRPLRR